VTVIDFYEAHPKRDHASNPSLSAREINDSEAFHPRHSASNYNLRLGDTRLRTPQSPLTSDSEGDGH
jgi:hypothetical protein